MTPGKGLAVLELTLEILKHGFICFPRLFVEYAGELGLDYEHLGKLLVFLGETEQYAGNAAAEYRVVAGGNVERYRQIRQRVQEFAELDLIKFEEPSSDQELLFSFMPLVSRLLGIMQEEALHRQEESSLAGFQELAAGRIGPASFLDQVAAHARAIRQVEHRIGRPLSPREIADIIDWIETYRFDENQVGCVVEEGIKRGITRFNYLNQIARSLYEARGQSNGELEGEPAGRSPLPPGLGVVMRRLGLNRRPTVAEQHLFEKWSKQLGLTDEIILKACDTTVNIKDPNFAYIDRVLSDWAAQGVRSAADVEYLKDRFERQRAPQRKAKQPAGTGVAEKPERRGKDYYEQFLKPSGK